MNLCWSTGVGMERPFPGALSWTWQYPQAGQAVTQIMPPRDNGVILPRTHSRFELASKKKKINSCACGENTVLVDFAGSQRGSFRPRPRQSQILGSPSNMGALAGIIAVCS